MTHARSLGVPNHVDFYHNNLYHILLTLNVVFCHTDHGQKMTTDGYIDINLHLDLKLLNDLVSSRELLIEAILPKLLVITGCTMDK